MKPQDDFVFFCFLDILGYRAHLTKDIENTSLDFKEKLEQSAQVFSQINNANYSIKAISDSIFIHSSSVRLIDFLTTIKKIQNHYLNVGLLIRGGISYSRHFESNSITYSLALTEAHKLENERAIVPRILISETIIDVAVNFQNQDAQYNYYSELRGSGLIIKDGEEYILNIIDSENLTQVHKKVREIYLESKDVIDKSVNLRSKYTWLEDYIMYTKPPTTRLNRFVTRMSKL